MWWMRWLEDERAKRISVIVGLGLVVVVVLWLLTPSSTPADPNAALARIDKAQAKQDVATLKAAAQSPDATVAARAVQALGVVGGAEARDVVRQSMQDSRWEVRQASASAWAKVGNRQNGAPLSGLIQKDPSPQVRRAAVSAADDLKAVDSVPDLIAALDDPDRSVRESAMYSLDHILGILVSHVYRPDDPPEQRKAAMAKITAQFNDPNFKQGLVRYYSEHH
jgi:HEAT repeat protein